MHALTTTARATGAWYLALALTGMLGFLVIRPLLFVEGDAAATAARLAEQPALAHAGVGLEMTIVVAQAVTAVWFYRLFHALRPAAAFAIAAFGMLNAAAIMMSSVFLATAVGVGAAGGSREAAPTVELLQLLSTHAWGVGSLFFGLWLIPMGWAVIRTGRMPAALGVLLVVGGAAYLLSGLVGYALVDPPSWAVELLPLVATAGELWMVGYLLSVGIRPAAATRGAEPAAVAV